MRKILKALSVAVAPIVTILTFITGCFNIGKHVDVEVDNKDVMQDVNNEPEQKAAYEQYTKQAFEEYYAVANNYLDEDGNIEIDNAEVVKAASAAAAKLYAYACYNERQLDQYVFFSNQEGKTDISNGSGTAIRQEYYLRVNEGENNCGYRYHYTIKKVTESSGALSLIKGVFESARTRITDKTNLLYRLEGDKNSIEFSEEINENLGCRMLTCNWSTGDDWGKPDIEMVKSEFIAPDKIEEDIIAHAGEDNITIRGNINIFAENLIKDASVFDMGDDYLVAMNLDTAVANSDEASLKMLRKANSSEDCKWVDKDSETGLQIVFRVWKNGLFRFYSIDECWGGTINGFKGTVDSVTEYKYSYSDRDCDMSAILEMLAKADAERNS